MKLGPGAGPKWSKSNVFLGVRHGCQKSIVRGGDKAKHTGALGVKTATQHSTPWTSKFFRKIRVRKRHCPSSLFAFLSGLYDSSSMSHEPRLPRLTPINRRYIAGRNEKRSQILLSAIRGRNVNEEFYMWIVSWLMSFQMSVMAFRYISVSCSGCLVVHESTCYLNTKSLVECITAA